MLSYKGKSVLDGIAIGKLYCFQKKENELRKQHIEDIQGEITRFETARKQTIQSLKKLYDKALEETGEEQAMIFEVHQMMLEDMDYIEAVINMIQTEKLNVEYVVTTVGEQFAAMFSSMTDNDYMQARAIDVKDISAQLVSTLTGADQGVINSEEPIILLADDLSPSETVQMDKSKILAFVTRLGSSNSHTSILARSMNIPSLVNTNIELLEEYNGKRGVVDGFEGILYIEPDVDLLYSMIQKKLDYERHMESLKAFIGKESVTKNGKKINLYANIGSAEDVEKVLANDAEGIGLFRSEFLYLGRDNYPTEEEQFTIYKKVLSKMNGKKVIIRTLDIGADKQADYFGIEKEENPAMGYRAIRICLDRTDIFKTQLRAIYRASAFGTASIMFPMIISVSEIIAIKKIVEEVKEDLNTQKISYGNVELGIMIETPAAVMISDDLAKEVQFFSIGTNDLTQYTLAIDRQNRNLDAIYNPHHKAVLRMIEMTIKNAHEAGIWAGICGELASDEELTKTFLGFGIDELSVSPTCILSLRKKIQEI